MILRYNISGGLTEEEADRQSAVNGKAAALFDKIAELFSDDSLNAEFYRDDVQIGHTYFLVSSEEQLYLRFKHQMLPILREYYKDGLFRFDLSEYDQDGRNGLLGCITGDVERSAGDGELREIFDNLIETD